MPPAEGLDPSVRDRVNALPLTLDGEMLTVTACRPLEADRAAVYAAVPGDDGAPLFPELAASGGVAVTATTEGSEVVETVLTLDGLKHCTVPDIMMMVDELALPQLPEARFTPDGPWVAAATGCDTLEFERGASFAEYEKAVTKLPPDCISALRRMLQDGPVCRLYAQGKLRGLRMPEADTLRYQTTNEKGKLTELPRPSIAVRRWDAEAREYVEIDNLLEGAPATDAAAEEWYKGVVAKLKGSPYLGPDNVDKMVTGTGQQYDDGVLVMLGEGSFKNKWTDLALSVKLS